MPGQVVTMPASLHLPTLIVAAALGIAFAGIMLVCGGWRDRAWGALTLWGSAMILSAAGLMFLVAGPLPRPMAEAVGDAVLVLGAGFSWAGARVFGGRRVSPALLAAGPVALLAAAALHGVDTSHLVLTVSFVGAYSWAAAAEIWRDRVEILPSRKTAVALASIHAVLQFGRAGLMGLAPSVFATHARSLYAAVFLEALLYAIGMACALLSMMREQTEYRSTLRLRDMTMKDELTGLGNRRRFEEALAQVSARRDGVGLLMVDVDHFKLYNDTYGHLPGDECLRALAAAIGQVTRRPDAIATRFGGEEFAILLSGTDESDATQVAARVHAAVAALAIRHATSPYGMLTVSIGVAAVAAGEMPDTLVRQADWALYVAKAEGRNGTRAASETKQSGVLRPTG
jgi:diguanylate cyclase (GGDEF)-like protein